MDSIPDSLIHWYNKSYRDLPWRRTKNPYHIWLSEIILQQTRVDQGLPYFEKFLKHYPSIEELADASEESVLKDWQGLGYYSRARNLHASAQYIKEEFNGRFPERYEDILKLKGVGPYTASAIASFAFDLPYPVVDGNVERVISRLFSINENLRLAEGKKKLKYCLDSVFPKEQAAVFNQAIMELGSQVCKPQTPDCQLCPLSIHCTAFANQRQASFPNLGKKLVQKELNYHYFVLRKGNSTWIQKRDKGPWNQLYEFPLIQGEHSLESALAELQKHLVLPTQMHIERSLECQHLLSHRKINAHFYTIHSEQTFQPSNSTIFEIDFRELFDRYPVSVLIEKYLKLDSSNGK